MQHRQKKIGDDVMSDKYDVIVIFLIYGQFGAIRKPDSGRIVYKTYIFININLLSYNIEISMLTKTENRTNTALTL